MQTRSMLIVAFALVCGGAAAVGVNVFGRGPKESGKTLAVVTIMDIPRGQTVTADMITSRPYPKEMLPPGVVTKADDVVGRSTLAPLVKDEPVLEGKLAAKGAGRGLAALIPKGMRAMAVMTPNVATGVAGFILPGNKVDVLMTMTENSGTGATTVTLLENIEILAVDQKVDAPAENKVDAKEMRSVTLLVTPSQQTKLDLALNKGVLHLSLRNPSDSKSAIAPPSTMADLQGGGKPSWADRSQALLAVLSKAMAQARPVEPTAQAPAPAPPAAPAPRIWTIRTLRGAHSGTIRFEAATDSRGL